MNTSGKEKVSLVIPALNEVRGIGNVIRNAYGLVDEIIVVDGGSTDGTLQHAEDVFNRKDVEALYRNRNRTTFQAIVEPRRGYGRALLTGILAAKHEIVATADADGTYPIESIPHMADLVRNGEIFVSTVRFPMHNHKAMSYRNFVGNKILTWVSNILFKRRTGVEFRDILSGMWVFRREMMQWITLYSERWDFSQEIKVEAAALCGKRFVQYQIAYEERHGESKLQPWRVGLSNLCYFFKHRFGVRHWWHSPIHAPEIDRNEWDSTWAEISEKSAIGPATVWRAWLIKQLLVLNGHARSRIANLGCGVGSLERQIAADVGEVWFSMDPSKLAIEKAQASCSLSNVHWLEGGLELLKTREQTFDVLIVSEVLEHMENPERFLEQISESVERGTWVIITCPNGPMSLFEKAIGHVDHYTPDRVRAMLPKKRFSVLGGIQTGWPFMNAMKRVLMLMSHDKAIAAAKGNPGRLMRWAFAFAAVLFRLNSKRRGYQTIVVLRRN